MIFTVKRVTQCVYVICKLNLNYYTFSAWKSVMADVATYPIYIVERARAARDVCSDFSTWPLNHAFMYILWCTGRVYIVFFFNIKYVNDYYSHYRTAIMICIYKTIFRSLNLARYCNISYYNIINIPYNIWTIIRCTRCSLSLISIILILYIHIL